MEGFCCLGIDYLLNGLNDHSYLNVYLAIDISHYLFVDNKVKGFSFPFHICLPVDLWHI